MPEPQDLNQIEYRHHPTRDLSPVASSMSPQSTKAWHAQVTAWVRHPHDERLSESACYQVFPSNGSAAFAWRYWDERVTERADGSRGRPLVSRVLAGPVAVLSPEAAIALSRTGPTADLTGMIPGDVPDGTAMPMVSAAAVTGLAEKLALEFDADAMRDNVPQDDDALQALVAAALWDPSVPLAVSLRESLIARSLRHGVQCQLLWGLRRVAGPVLGQVGRGWSFSTFELPQGETDTASLPGIVFRRAQDTRAATGANWRKELKVRPFAPDVLADTAPYAGRVELAGWLVDEYRERGGEGLAAFLADAGGGEQTLQGRLERLRVRLGHQHGVVIPAAPEPPAEPATKLELAEPAPAPAAGAHPLAAAPAVLPVPEEEAFLPGPQEDDALSPAPGAGVLPPVPQEMPLAGEVTVAVPAFAISDAAAAGILPVTPPPGPAAPPRPLPGRPDEERPDPATFVQQAGTGPRGRPLLRVDDWDNGAGGNSQWPEPAAPVEDAHPGQPTRETPQFRPHPDDAVAPPRDGRAPDLPFNRRVSGPLPPSPQSLPQQPPSAPQPLQPPQQQRFEREQPYPRSGPPDYQQDPAPQPAQPPPPVPATPPRSPGDRRQPTVNFLLKQLELTASDPDRFRAHLDALIWRRDVDDAEDRLKSWELISGKSWFPNTSKCGVLQQPDLARIFSIVLIPELRRGGVREEVIANWAFDAPTEMIAGLLAAAMEAEDQRPAVHAILEPVLATRWANENYLGGLWDHTWPEAAARADRRDGKNRRWGDRLRPHKR